MDSTTVATMTQLLDELGARFGATGTRLWGELVAYQVAGAWMGFIGAMVPVVFCLAVGLVVIKWGLGTEPDGGWLQKEFAVFLAAMCALFVLVGTVILMEDFGVLVQTLTSPEAAVVHSLLER